MTAEGYRKRNYPAHFKSKITDADMENTETQVWLDFSIEYKYIDQKQYEKLKLQSEEIGRLLNFMFSHLCFPTLKNFLNQNRLPTAD
ncbi:MAG: four helix bundle protein [Syntrophothermus sp.]